VRLLRNPNFDFLKIQKPFVLGSIAAALISAGAIATKGLNWGVDFTGGAQIVYAFQQKPDEDQVRKIVEGAKVPVTSIQRYDRADKNQLLLRVPMEAKEGRDISGEVTPALTKALFPKGLEPGVFDLNLNGADPLASRLQRDDPEKMAGRADANPTAEYARIAQSIIANRSETGLFASVEAAAATPGLSPAVASWLKEKAVAGPVTLISAESVGPAVGRDLRNKGTWAVVLSWGAILVYVWLRFRSISYGTGVVLALVHDAFIALGLCAIFGVEISLTVVAAFLTLIGYSANDTVVIYDRIRENLEKPKKEPLPLLVNRSINETLSRTFLTQFLTFLTVAALLFFGGEVLRGFSFVLFVGAFIGAYSTIFIAAPWVVNWETWKAKRAAAHPASVPDVAKPGKAAAKGR
jgi:preprotein translocase subunit SecF